MTSTKLPEKVEEKIAALDANPFLDGPTEFLTKTVCEEIVKVPAFALTFGDFIDHYMRMDYAVRNLPALRIYNSTYAKTAESWYIEGELTADIIWPASLRRGQLQLLPDMVTAALIQQFRRPTFFRNVCARVHGLNTLGKTMRVDKGAAFEIKDGELVPLTQISIDFRIDLSAWDRWLEEDARTKDEPFERTLQDLAVFIGKIGAVRDDATAEELAAQENNEVEIGVEQSTSTED